MIPQLLVLPSFFAPCIFAKAILQEVNRPGREPRVSVNDLYVTDQHGNLFISQRNCYVVVFHELYFPRILFLYYVVTSGELFRAYWVFRGLFSKFQRYWATEEILRLRINILEIHKTYERELFKIRGKRKNWWKYMKNYMKTNNTKNCAFAWRIVEKCIYSTNHIFSFFIKLSRQVNYSERTKFFESCLWNFGEIRLTEDILKLRINTQKRMKENCRRYGENVRIGGDIWKIIWQNCAFS